MELDFKMIQQHETNLTLKLTRLITSEPQSKELSAGTVMSLSNCMIIMLLKMVGKEKALEFASDIINRSFKITTGIAEAEGVKLPQ
jgi:hypothetical protein